LERFTGAFTFPVILKCLALLLNDVAYFQWWLPNPFMMNHHAWNVLCWNVRGMNDKEKWDSIRNKIDESNANIFSIKNQKIKFRSFLY
jgi:hypothetical protein